MIVDQHLPNDPGVLAVTGGASGIGFLTARLWIEAGGVVVLLDRDARALEAAVTELGTSARGIETDVTDTASVNAAFADIAATEARVDALVTCAGIVRRARLVDLDDAAWSTLLEIHLGGAMRTSRAAHPLLAEAARRTGQSAVVNLASVAGLSGTPGRASYSTAKAGVTGLTRTLAVEWAPDGIRVNAVAPALVRTAMVDGLLAGGAIDLDSVSRRTPLGRIAEPREVAAPIVFLLSPAASYITGTCLAIDGGLTIEGNWFA